jgi:hypothetical protein
LRVGDLVQYTDVSTNFLGIVVEEIDTHQVSVCYLWKKKLYTSQLRRQELEVISLHKKNGRR